MGAVACLFVASCSTSPDGEGSFALTNSVATPDVGGSPVASNQPQDAASATTPTTEGALPDQVAFLPGSKPGEAAPDADAAVTAEAEGIKPPVEPSATVTADAPAAKPAVKEQVLTASPSADTEQILTSADPAALAPAPKKRGFLSSLFSTNQASAAPSPAAAKTAQLAKPAPAKEPEAATPLVKLASIDPAEKSDPSGSVSGSWGSDALPGVRKSALFEIKRRSGLNDDSDVDIHEEDEYPAVRVASAAGMARLAPNGLLRQTDSVDVGCLKPGLVKVLRQIEGHFGRKVVVTSGYRSPSYNKRVRGAKRSQHMFCAAADIQVAGITKFEIANYVRSLPGRGGVGTYCHTESVHVDIGPERDWNWRCRRRKA